MRKVYVQVRADFRPDGTIIPLRIVWEDGRKFEIEKVLDVRPGTSLKVGAVGTRYTIQVRGKQSYLWLEDGKWFVSGRG